MVSCYLSTFAVQLAFQAGTDRLLASEMDKGARSSLYLKFMSAAPGGGLPDQTVKRKICMIDTR